MTPIHRSFLSWLSTSLLAMALTTQVLAQAPITFQYVYDELGQLIDYESMRGGESLEVRIRSDRRVPYRVIEPILVACAKAGAWNVTFAVIAGE